jgi:hypothetical protein
MPRWTFILLVAFTLAACVANAADAESTGSGWHVDSRIVLAVAGAMSVLFWKLLDAREAGLKLQLEELTRKLNERLTHIDAKLSTITRLEYEIQGLSLLAQKADATSTKLNAHELDYARSITQLTASHQVLRDKISELVRQHQQQQE